MTDNLRACLLMVATMAGFSVEDLFIKQVAGELPIGQIMFILGVGGATFFGLVAMISRQPLWSSVILSRPFLIRNAAEMVSMSAGTTALVLLPLSLTSSILQAAPILVTAGAAIFLGEKVGWRRWTAVCVGLVGVMLILKPGAAGFQPAVLLVVLAVICLAARDVATRAVKANISTLQLSFWGYFLSIIAGGLLFLFMGEAARLPSFGIGLRLLAAQCLGITFYYTLNIALRLGEASVVVPFRYTRLIFAIALGMLVLGERLETTTIVGLGLVVASGLYAFLREARLSRLAKTSVMASPSL
jgi:drug/metabolite transporter (DMT)-like permease